MPLDNKGAYEWNTKELPALLAGWDTSKGGSPKYKAQKLRIMEGGLDRQCSRVSFSHPRF